MSFVLVCFVTVYMGYHAVTAFGDPLQTVGAVQFTVEDVIPVEGWFIRDEHLIPCPGGYSGHNAEPCADDGTRVAKGDAIVEFYSDQTVALVNAQLRETERRISDMEHARGVTLGGAVDAAHMDMLIYRNLADMHDARDRRSSVEGSMLEFKSMVFRREYVFGGGADLSSALESLNARAAALSGGKTGAAYTLDAPEPGTFSASVDGYEETLTPDILKDFTVDDYMALGSLRNTAGGSEWKLALGYKWFHVILLPEEETRSMLIPGQLALRFAYEGAGDVVFNVESVSAPKDGQAAVVLSTTRNIGEFVNARRMPADLVLRSFSGLRVPKNAIRRDDKADAFGVYCLAGNQIMFKRVDIITERENYYLVKFDPLTATLRNLLPGDEMVVKGKDIYDGKVYLQS